MNSAWKFPPRLALFSYGLFPHSGTCSRGVRFPISHFDGVPLAVTKGLPWIDFPVLVGGVPGVTWWVLGSLFGGRLDFGPHGVYGPTECGRGAHGPRSNSGFPRGSICRENSRESDGSRG